jgi:hypothetical protein
MCEALDLILAPKKKKIPPLKKNHNRKTEFGVVA